MKSKREALALAESRIKSELNEVSEIFETKTKAIVIISAISGVVLLGAYGVYSFFSKPKKSEKPLQRKAKEIKKNYDIKKVLLEKITSTALNYASKEFKKALDKKRTS